MARKIFRTYNGMFAGDLTPFQIRNIIAVKEMKCVESLKNCIYSIPADELTKAANLGMSYRKYADSNNVDINQFRAELRDEQTIGVAFMYFSNKSILGDSVGYGKTVELAALLNVLYEKCECNRFLVAVEISAVDQTLLELIRRTGLNIITLPSVTYKLEKVIGNVIWEGVDGLVVSHSMLENNLFQTYLSKYIINGKNTLFNTFILDESSVIKNSKTRIYKNVEVINRYCDRVHYLNATPFENSILDAYNQINSIDSSIMPSLTDIREEYCVYKRGVYWIKENGVPKMKYKFELDSYKNQEDFKKRIGLIYIGRYMTENKNKYRIEVVYPTVEQLTAIAMKYRAMEILNCPTKLDQSKLKDKVEFTEDGIPKLKRLKEIVQNECVGKKVMVYCFHRDAQDKIFEILTSIGRHCVILNGSIMHEDRHETINEFNQGDADTIITNIKKSINLYDGDYCIIYSMETNPAKLEQISGRIDRHVDDKIKTYIMLIYAGTNEERLVKKKMLERSNSARDLVTGAESAINRFLDGDNDVQ